MIPRMDRTTTGEEPLEVVGLGSHGFWAGSWTFSDGVDILDCCSELDAATSSIDVGRNIHLPLVVKRNGPRESGGNGSGFLHLGLGAISPGAIA